LIHYQDFAVLPCLYFLTYAKFFTRNLSGSPAFIICIHTEFYKPCFNGSLVLHHYIRWCACDRAWRSAKCTTQLHNQHLVRDASVPINVTTLLPKYWHHKTCEIWNWI